MHKRVDWIHLAQDMIAVAFSNVAYINHVVKLMDVEQERLKFLVSGLARLEGRIPVV
jgi:hypothetical protein